MPYSHRSSRTFNNSRYSRSKPRQYQQSRQRTRTEYVDPSRFIKAAVPASTAPISILNSFQDFDLHHLLRQNISSSGYKVPTPIQDQAIPVGLAGKDIIGIASTGTGKTAAFALPVLQRLLTDPRSAVLIIAPTRELAQQIEAECNVLARGSGLKSVLLIGGSNMGFQLRALRFNPRIVIGTPGRIKDHLQRGTLRLQNFNMVVLDEVDRMLDMGFINDVTEILSRLNATRQSFFFSATFDPRVRKLVDTFSKDPQTIMLKASAASENVHQNVVRYQGSTDKLSKLHDLLIQQDVKKVIVFDDTQRAVERLHRELIERGFSADSLHGGKSQGQRQRALKRLKTDEITILVATDVAARGLDVADITHVVNYSVPKVFDDYIHRIGRAGRAGKVGHALTFIAH
jgi:ATP-dependent RNA helicase RhlE